MYKIINNFTVSWPLLPYLGLVINSSEDVQNFDQWITCVLQRQTAIQRQVGHACVPCCTSGSVALNRTCASRAGSSFITLPHQIRWCHLIIQTPSQSQFSTLPDHALCKLLQQGTVLCLAHEAPKLLCNSLCVAAPPSGVSPWQLHDAMQYVHWWVLMATNAHVHMTSIGLTRYVANVHQVHT